MWTRISDRIHMITLASSKGRIFEETLPTAAARRASRFGRRPGNLAQADLGHQPGPDVRVLWCAPPMCPRMWQYGGADLGITGKDTLLEHGGEGLYQPLDLQIAKVPHAAWRCAQILTTHAAVRQGSRLKVATKYVAIARDFFASKGVHVDLIKLYGSMELAPLVGLADAIVDLGVHRQHAQGQPPGRGGAHHGHQLPPGGQPSCAQAQTRTHPQHHRRLCRRRSRHKPGSLPIRYELPYAASPPDLSTTDAAFEAQFKARLHWSAGYRRGYRAAAWPTSWPTCSQRGDAAVLEYTARFDGLHVDRHAGAWS